MFVKDKTIGKTGDYQLLKHLPKMSKLGNGTGMGNPCGLQVQVPVGMGTGQEYYTHVTKTIDHVTTHNAYGSYCPCSIIITHMVQCTYSTPVHMYKSHMGYPYIANPSNKTHR